MLTRELLSELELTDEAIERILSAHEADVDALTPGEGLESAARAYLEWIDSIRERFPNVLFETCSSGGMRMDYETLSHFSIVSTSDQVKYRKYPAQVAADQHRDARRAALCSALEKMGANPNAIPLLVDSIQLPEDCWQGDALVDAAILNNLQGKYAGLFARRTALPVTYVQPPVDITGALTPMDVMRMSAEDINRNWSAVRTALQNH